MTFAKPTRRRRRRNSAVLLVGERNERSIGSRLLAGFTETGLGPVCGIGTATLFKGVAAPRKRPCGGEADRDAFAKAKIRFKPVYKKLPAFALRLGKTRLCRTSGSKLVRGLD